LQTQLNGLNEELNSLKQQIERSKKERKAKLEQEKNQSGRANQVKQ